MGAKYSYVLFYYKKIGFSVLSMTAVIQVARMSYGSSFFFSGTPAPKALAKTLKCFIN